MYCVDCTLSSPPSSKVRGTNYSIDEDCALVRSRARISEDPFIGTEQKRTSSLDPIWKEYESSKLQVSSLKSLSTFTTRARTVVKEYVKFSAWFASVFRAKLSGVNEEILKSIASGLFNGFKMTSPTDDPGRCSWLLEAWKILKFHIEFMCGSEGYSVDSNRGEGSPSEDAGNDDIIATPTDVHKVHDEESIGTFNTASEVHNL